MTFEIIDLSVRMRNFIWSLYVYGLWSQDTVSFRFRNMFVVSIKTAVTDLCKFNRIREISMKSNFSD